MKRYIAAAMLTGFIGVTVNPTITRGEEGDQGTDPMPSPTPGVFPNWVVQLFNVDDRMQVECNGRVVGGSNYGVGPVNVLLNSCLQVGVNTISIVAYNNSVGPWTFGYRMLKNGQVATTVDGRRAERSCGQVIPGGVSQSCTPNPAAGWRYRKGYRIERLQGQ